MYSSSSSSSTNPQYLHDVFINFRGEDVRRTFVSHLYAVLSNAGINTFLDNEKLEKGEDIGHELLQAISVSRISIIVFSKNYTESSWCLNELEKIMECRRLHGHVVLPVFYDVDPSVVRHQKGDFGKALEVAAKSRYIIEEVMVKELGKWRKVLTEASNLSGWDGSAFRSDRELVKKIVEAILPKLDNTTLSITEFPVGLESHVKQVVGVIEKHSGDVCMVGIWGMGGSGKTTVAKAIYNEIHRRFDCTSFIENIREVCEKDTKGHIHLQQQLLSDVLKTKEKIHSIASGTATIQRELTGKKALVILDDVTDFQQIKALCGNHKFFGAGSVLIVTTRDVHILKLLNVDSVYKMEEMQKNESLELFSWHAFRKASPRGGFSELSRNVAAYCGGLPLALEVLGSYLFERTKQEWISVLSKLERIPNDQVHEKLRISYDGLKDDMVKDIFLDICCFFIGKDRAYVTEILNGCGLYADIGIAVLIDRSLLKVEKNNKLGMHDLIRDMGREIVRESSAREPGKRSRLWFHEDVHDVLAKNTGTETVEALIFNLQRTGRGSFSTNTFQDMKKLRLLQLDRVDLTGDFGYLSKQLRWVNWQRSTFNFVPNDFDQENLVAFELKYSNVKQVWKETKLLHKLKILNLSHSKHLKRTPDFSKLPNLEKLIMKDCQSLSDIHPSIGDLKNLLLINLKDCASLVNLPREIYRLRSVKTLILSGCSKIVKLEEDIVQMKSLTTLIAENAGVKQVPFSIVRSKNITHISLCGYQGLSRDVFPSIIWSWMSPTMNSLARIPSFGGISMSLVSLNIDSDNLGLVYQSPILSSCSKLRCVSVQCHSEIQLKQELKVFLNDLTELEISHASQISDLSLQSLLIGMGSYHKVNETLGKSLSQGLATNDSRASFLPGNNIPSWLAYTCEGPSVCFQVPKDSNCGMKGITLCVLYSSTSQPTRRRRSQPSDPPARSSSSYSKLDKASKSDGKDEGLKWTLPFFALGILRYMSATSNIIHDCDEVFNYWEPLHFLLYKTGFQTWEYSSQFALRSYLYLLFHEIVARPALWVFGDDKVRVFYAVRFFLGFLSVVTETVLVVAISRKYGKRLACYTLAMLCLASGCFFASTSFLPSSFSMYAISLASGLFLLDKHAAAVAVSAIGVILGWPFSILAFLPVTLYSLYIKFKQAFIGGAVTSVILLALSVVTDYNYYGKWTSSVLNLLIYNVAGGGESHLYGTEGPLFYLKNGFNNFNFCFVLAMLFLGILPIAKKKYAPDLLIVISPLYIWLGFMSLQPHKEERFLYPVYPLICVAASAVIESFPDLFRDKYDSSDNSLIVKVAKFLRPVVLSIILYSSHARTFSLIHGYQAPIEIYKILEHHDDVANGSVLCVGSEWHRYPSSFFVPDFVGQVRWIDDGFGGLLPFQFNSTLGGTAAAPPYFNNKNMASEEQYLHDIDACTFLVELQLKRPYLTRGSELSTWEAIAALPYLDRELSPALYRSFFIPYLWQEKNVFGMYKLLRRIPK